MNALSRIKDYLKTYGLGKGIKVVVSRLFFKSKAKKEMKKLTPKLDEQYSALLVKLSQQQPIRKEPVKRIFFFWWDGLKEAPQIVKMNASNLLNLYSKDYEIIFIDKTNYTKIVNIPDEIKEKLERKEITIQMFSDYLRASLLSQLGGIWIDSTVYLPARIEFATFLQKYGYYTLVTPESKKFFTYKSNPTIWSSFLIGGCKNNPVFTGFVAIFDDYLCKNANKKRPYFLLDMVLMLLRTYHVGNDCMAAFAHDNEQEGSFSYLSDNLSKQYSDEDMKKIGDTPQKLNWRIDIEKSPDNSLIRLIYKKITEATSYTSVSNFK